MGVAWVHLPGYHPVWATEGHRPGLVMVGRHPGLTVLGEGKCLPGCIAGILLLPFDLIRRQSWYLGPHGRARDQSLLTHPPPPPTVLNGQLAKILSRLVGSVTIPRTESRGLPSPGSLRPKSLFNKGNVHKWSPSLGRGSMDPLRSRGCLKTHLCDG